MRKFILGKEQNIERDSLMWNVVGGMLNACQSALLLIVISRTNPIEDQGIYALAYAIATMVQMIGMFGMRHFQASDVNEKYKVNTYFASRVVSSLMLVALLLFFMIRGYVFRGYSVAKSAVILICGLLKLLDAIEDVFHGRLQQKGRLDVAAKCMATRYIAFMCVVGAGLIVSHSLPVAFTAGFVFSCVYILWTYSVYNPIMKGIDVTADTDISDGAKGESLKPIFDKRVFDLLKANLVVTAGGFLLSYIASAPKYAIDKYLGEAEQACFNYIFMPVFVVSTLSLYIYQPTITKLANYLKEDDKKNYDKTFLSTLLLILGLCIAVIIGGFLLGIPVLSLLYNTDLSTYKTAFMILLVGSSFLAFAQYFSVVVIVLRGQNLLLAGYVIPAAIALFTSGYTIRVYGTVGAAILYAALIAVQMVLFLAVYLYKRRK